jgi:hypothetical protein
MVALWRVACGAGAAQARELGDDLGVYVLATLGGSALAGGFWRFHHVSSLPGVLPIQVAMAAARFGRHRKRTHC